MGTRTATSLATAAELGRGVRASLRNNAGAYGYSVMVSAGYGALDVTAGPADLPRIFWFLAGAAGAFALLEGIALGFLRDRERSEPEKVIALGAVLGLGSISTGVAVMALVGSLVGGPAAWPLASFLGTMMYLGVVGLEVMFARRIEPDT